MTDTPIKGNGTKKIEIDMGKVNCINEPYMIDLSGNKFILRYKSSITEGDYGRITLEAMAD